MNFSLDRPVSDALKAINGVVDAVTLKNQVSGKTYAFIVFDEGKTSLDKITLANKEKKVEKIWEMVWNNTYSKTDLERSEDDFDSWLSVYDKKRIPLPEMLEYRRNTIDRIKQLHPKALLEIGCGTGLLLWKLRHLVEMYLGIDPSEHAVEKLNGALKAKEVTNVQVKRASANQIEEYLRQRFDTVIMNSVVQYFPSPGYLRSVIEAVLRAGCDSLFIGDIKSQRHRAAFQASVGFYQAIGTAPAKSCLKESEHVQANELSVSEEFLELLAGDAYGLELQLKREGHFNEMSRYRYDATFHRLNTPGVVRPDISSNFASMEALEALISANPGATVEILGIPNSRIVSDVWAFEHAPLYDGTVQELLKLAEIQKADSIEPAQLFGIGDKFSLTTRVVFARGDLSRVDALFELKGGDVRTWIPKKGIVQPFYANDPMGTVFRERIRAHLLERSLQMNLARHPDEIVVIDQLPRKDGSLDTDQLVALISA